MYRNITLALLVFSVVSFADDFQCGALFEIGGVAVGQASDLEGLTGVTVLRFDSGVTAGVRAKT